MSLIGNQVGGGSGSGGTVAVYDPAMMEYDGSTGYYTATSITTADNKQTLAFRVNADSFTGSAALYQVAHIINASSRVRMGVQVYSADHAQTSRAGKLHCYIQNDSGTLIGRFQSIDTIIDGLTHTVIISFDSDLGTAQIIIDGVSAIDTGNADYIAPAIDTLADGACTFSFGATADPLNHAGCDIGFFGYRDAYLTNWQDFMETDGHPKYINEATYPAWNGGTAGFPAMTYNSASYYSRGSTTSTGNKFTVVARFAVPSDSIKSCQLVR